MIERKYIGKKPREHFMHAAEDELEKFVSKELAFQQADRDARAAELRLPVAGKNRRGGQLGHVRKHWREP